VTTTLLLKRPALHTCVRFSRSAITLFATSGRFRGSTAPYRELIRIEPA
jgi:hypothetical protein